jgi:cysteine desulfurase
MDRIVYLDNAATTRCDPRVAEAVERALLEDYGNPSSVHPLGVRAARALRAARETIARALDAEPAGVFFTSGGTEANNLALLGFARMLRRRGRHVVVSAVEHPSTLGAAKALEEEGFETTAAPVDGKARIDLTRLEASLRADTVAVAVMLANNEVGTIEPVADAARLVRARSPHAALHVDAVQAFGKIPVSIRSLGADSVAISAHKIHGPKGAGALVLASRRLPRPLVFGGGQEEGLRPGTENLPGIVGLAKAASIALESLDAEGARVRALRDRLAEGLARRVPDFRRNGDPEACVPTILSATFPGVPAEALLHHLERKGIYVSAGAACHAKKASLSHVLLACGLERSHVSSTLRFSLGRFTTEEDVAAALEAVPAAVEELRALAS